LNISTILDKLGKGKKPAILAIFLGISLVFIGFLLSDPSSGAAKGILGGPESVQTKYPLINEILGAFSPGPLLQGMVLDVSSEVDDLQNGLLKADPFFSTDLPEPDVIIYTVVRGDNFQKIADRFKITVAELKSSNPGVKTLRSGQKLVVSTLPVYLYKIKEGDTPEAVAANFDVTLSSLVKANNNATLNSLFAGMLLTIPGKEGVVIKTAQAESTLPSLSGYFIRPTPGVSFGRLHPKNAVDIANICGTAVVASQEGLVLDAEVNETGYGHYVRIEHPNGTKTLYAHMDEILVSAGDYVRQGQKIGTVGKTGEATGCHVHFEVDGAKNPFASN